MSGVPSKHAVAANIKTAIVVRENHKWFAVYKRNAFESRRCHLSQDDTWNFDIDRGLEITVEVDEAVTLDIDGNPDPKGMCVSCKIQRRKGNKCYVKIGGE